MSKTIKFYFFSALFLLSSNVLFAKIVPDFLFQDNFVFCAGKPAKITGNANPDEKLTLKMLEKTYTTIADANGRFVFDIPALPVIKLPFEIVISDSSNQSIVIRNVLSGLVFLAGGQSNMEVMVKETLNPEKEAASANYPAIREFKVEHDFDFSPQTTLKGKWTVVSPKTAPDIGAAAFYCARILHNEMNGIPVGIINNSFSASPQDAWLPEESAEKFASKHRLNIFKKYKKMGKEGMIKKRDELESKVILRDPGNDGEIKGWHKTDFDDSSWKDISIPSMLEEVYGEKDGAYWFRRTIELPEECAGKDLQLTLGAVDDYDTTYFNGVVIGKTGPEVPDSWSYKRVYTIPGKLVKAGTNKISIRCFDARCAGGLFDPPMNIKMNEKIVCNLKGLWKTEAERIMNGIPYPGELYEMICVHRMACALYNAMFAPLKGTPVNAILWYQGESNSDEGKRFEDMFQECIRVWRHDLGDDNNEIPFLFVQLAAYRKPESDAMNCGHWPDARDRQAKARSIPNVYMVPAIDIGDANHIHPKNKQEVGRRFALWLLQDVFHHPKFAKSVVYPEIVSAELSSDAKYIVIKLKNAKGLKTANDKTPHSFAVCGEPETVKQKKGTIKIPVWRFADAVIENDSIRVTVPPEIKGKPIGIRYGWMANPEVNVYNALGFPLLPGSFPVVTKQ